MGHVLHGSGNLNEERTYQGLPVLTKEKQEQLRLHYVSIDRKNIGQIGWAHRFFNWLFFKKSYQSPEEVPYDTYQAYEALRTQDNRKVDKDVNYNESRTKIKPAPQPRFRK